MASKKTAVKKTTSKKKTSARTAKTERKKAGASRKKTASAKAKPKTAKKKTTSKKTSPGAARKASRKPSASRTAVKPAPARKAKAASAAPDAYQPGSVQPLEKRISKEDLREIRNKLVSRRRELLGSMDAIEAEYLGTKDNVTTRGGDEADQASTALTADLSLRLAESESRELQEIEVALGKLEDGTYGICEATGQQIDVRRLRYLPSARLSREAQEKLEQHQLHYDEVAGWVSNED